MALGMTPSRTLTLLNTILLITTLNADNLEITNCKTAKGTSSTDESDIAAGQIQSLISSLTVANNKLANPDDYPQHYTVSEREEFDFIVVGAGSAGAVVANRLSELSSWRVLLLEAGGNPTKTSEVPALMGLLQNTPIDWQYRSDPGEDNCLGMEGGRCSWPRGKVLGGSSTINYMVYTRGNAKDYDQWAEDGNIGWGYKDVLPYFKKLEDMRAEEILAKGDFDTYHNKGGPITVETWPNYDVRPLANVFAEGMKELGYSVISDITSHNQTGFGAVQGTLKDGKRCSTAKAYLTPARRRKNLKVSKYSLVTKILIDDSKNAYGVQFTNKKGQLYTVLAKKEVVLSAGALNSPQILMLSGVGPRSHLENFKIKVVNDLPVGKNLQDHPMSHHLVISLNYSKSFKRPEENMFDFLTKNNSLYSSLGMVTYPMFINTVKDVDYPDMECLSIDFNKNSADPISRFLSVIGITPDIQREYLNINKKSYSIMLVCSLQRAYSRGSIQLNSTDPNMHPIIRPGYFSDIRDIETYLRVDEFISQFVQTKSMKSINAEVHEIKVPACNKWTFSSREYKECILRHLTTSTFHYSGTCKMGPVDSPDTVVDPQLRVKGVRKLRVIDASIMPKVVTGHTNVPTIMIGEKGSDLIKQAWKDK